jgi:hypothetical protein
MQGHLHTDGLIHLVCQEDVGWLEPVYGFISFCGVLRAGHLHSNDTWISTPSGHAVAQATCLLCVVEAHK